MIQNTTNFRWTPRLEKAALLVAEDDLSDEKIAGRLKVARSTLDRWKSIPEFQSRVAEIVQILRDAILTQGIADRVNRVRRLDTDWKRMQLLIEARALETPRDVPGASTGLIVRKEKETKFGTVVEYQADTALLAELRATEMQAAKELGQWTEKTEQKIHGSVTLFEDIPEDELKRRLAKAAAAMLPDPADPLRGG